MAINEAIKSRLPPSVDRSAMNEESDRRRGCPGWHFDEDTGALMRDVIHRMGRRCRNWDYCGRGTYQITLTLADRRSGAAAGGRPLCAAVLEPKRETIAKPLNVTGAETRDMALGAAARAPSSLFSEGYVDTILFDAAAVAHARAYLADNPRRLWEKRAHPELFAVLRDLPVTLGEGLVGHFAAIGNHNLLKAHEILQVQCSRRFFAYARDSDGRQPADARARPLALSAGREEDDARRRLCAQPPRPVDRRAGRGGNRLQGRSPGRHRPTRARRRWR